MIGQSEKTTPLKMKHHPDQRLNKKPTSWLSHSSITDKNVWVQFPNPKEKFEGIFWKATWPLLVLSQIFGVMPICGVTSGSLLELQFKWKSKRTFWSLILTVSLTIHVFLLFGSALTFHDGIWTIGVYIFFGFNLLSFYCFLWIATKWQKLMKFWSDIEREVASFHSAQEKRRFILKVRFITFGILFLAMVEHIIDFAPSIYFSIINGDDSIASNDKIEAPYMYSHFSNGKEEISIPKLVFVRIICIVGTVVNNYSDVFVISLGLTLSKQFELFNDELNRTQGEQTSQWWSFRRRQYTKLRDLVKNVDKIITHLIFLSFAHNLFAICRNLFLSLRPLPTISDRVYFWYSLALIFVRTCVMSFALARIHDESKEPIDILYAVPSNSWNVETDRFLNEITNSTIALSGLRFFFITRKMLLSVVGTIVTYELVLLNWQVNT